MTAVLVGLLPGWAIAWAAGLRGLTALACAPVLSYGVTAVAGPASTFLGLGWNPLVLVAATVPAVGLCLLVTGRRSARDPRAGTDPPGTDRRAGTTIGLGVVAGAVLGAVTVLRGAGGFGSVHQGWDAAFHANAIRLVLDTGRADPASTGLLSVGQGEDYYYPNALHVLSAVVGRVTGAEIPDLLTVQMMLLPGIAGLGLAVLVRRCGARVAVAAVVPLMLASFSGFTYDLYSRGPLLPFATGLALIPGLLVLVECALGPRWAAPVLATGLAATGLLAVHPGAALSAAVIGVLLLAQRALSASTLRADVVRVAAIGAVAVVCGLPYLAGLLATGESGVSYDWPARDGLAAAVRNLVLADPGGRTPQYLLVALVAIGVTGIVALRGLWWWLGAGAVAAVGFLAVSVSDAPVVEQLSQPWWNDRWRFLALVVLAVVPLSAQGLVMVADAVGTLLARARLLPRRPALASALAVLVVLAGVGAVTGVFYGGTNRDEVSRSYRSGPVVTAAEEAAMTELAQLGRAAGSTGRVMNDPGDGSAWMYALDGVRPVFGFSVDTNDRSALPEDQSRLMQSFRCLDSDPQIRALVQEYDITFVYTGPGFLRARFDRIPGLRDLDDVRSLLPVYAVDGAAIYRVRLTEQPVPPRAGSSCATPVDGTDAG